MLRPASAPESGAASRSPSIQDKVRFLSSPAPYRERPARVEVRQTHMSWLFLTDSIVYKLKKPVVYPFLDFRSLQARAADCRDELVLNRRLAPNVYLGLSCLRVCADGGLLLADASDVEAEGAGELVEWLVRMRRLPEDLTLDSAIRSARLTAGQIGSVGAVLAAFYRHLAPCGVTGAEHIALLKAQHALNAEMLRRPQFALDSSTLTPLLEALQRWIEDESALLHARVRDGRVVEGHGDLRPEHVFLTDPPVVIDCLEFKRQLRLVDWADEIAFLGLECARLGAEGVGPTLRAQLESALDDAVPDRLFHFYGAFRACLRARLALAHLTEPEPPASDKWPRLAREYLDLAAVAVARMQAAR